MAATKLCMKVMLLCFLMNGSGLLEHGIFARDFKSMIRYDRIWECTSCENYDVWLKYMRFDKTEKINGKEYHRLVTFKRIFPMYDPVTGLRNYDKVSDGLLENEGYLREEDGMVYTLLERDDENPGESFLGHAVVGSLYQPSEGFEPEDVSKLIEVPIYNLNTYIGKSYEGVTFIKLTAVQEEFKVTNIWPMIIDDEECMRIEISPACCWWDGSDEWNHPKYGIIEGIGVGSYGCLNYHELCDRPSGMWSHNSLNRVFHESGRLIYCTEYGPSYQDLQFPEGFSSVPLHILNDIPTPGIYDIMGREISRPAPGQVYIKGGKKYVAPVR